LWSEPGISVGNASERNVFCRKGRNENFLYRKKSNGKVARGARKRIHSQHALGKFVDYVSVCAFLRDSGSYRNSGV
ncbi:MAG: hypothetical protein FWC60_10905, partial [Firmicutes bacterium]|nr:hypothetical protein [Bacillota bacterium]